MSANFSGSTFVRESYRAPESPSVSSGHRLRRRSPWRKDLLVWAAVVPGIGSAARRGASGSERRPTSCYYDHAGESRGRQHVRRVQGGLIATLVDVAGGQFGLDYLQPGTTMTTADLFIRYLRPVRQGAAFAVPRMLRSGRRAMVMQIDIYGDADELLATATVNFAVIEGNTPKLPSWPDA